MENNTHQTANSNNPSHQPQNTSAASNNADGSETKHGVKRKRVTFLEAGETRPARKRTGPQSPKKNAPNKQTQLEGNARSSISKQPGTSNATLSNTPSTKTHSKSKSTFKSVGMKRKLAETKEVEAGDKQGKKSSSNKRISKQKTKASNSIPPSGPSNQTQSGSKHLCVVDLMNEEAFREMGEILANYEPSSTEPQEESGKTQNQTSPPANAIVNSDHMENDCSNQQTCATTTTDKIKEIFLTFLEAEDTHVTAQNGDKKTSWGSKFSSKKMNIIKNDEEPDKYISIPHQENPINSETTPETTNPEEVKQMLLAVLEARNVKLGVTIGNNKTLWGSHSSTKSIEIKYDEETKKFKVTYSYTDDEKLPPSEAIPKELYDYYEEGNVHIPPNEVAKFKAEINKKFKIVNVPGDGNCFYYAIAEGEFGDMTKQKRVREAVLRALKDDSLFDRFIFIYDPHNEQEHLYNNVLKDGSYATENCIVAAAIAYNKEITLYKPGLRTEETYNHDDEIEREEINIMLINQHYYFLKPRSALNNSDPANKTTPKQTPKTAEPGNNALGNAKKSQQNETPGTNEVSNNQRDRQQTSSTLQNPTSNANPLKQDYDERLTMAALELQWHCNVDKLRDLAKNGPKSPSEEYKRVLHPNPTVIYKLFSKKMRRQETICQIEASTKVICGEANCNEAVISNKQIIKHYAEKHRIPLYTCSYCYYETICKNITDHHRENHKQHNLICCFCNEPSDGMRKLTNHFPSDHTVEIGYTFEDDISSNGVQVNCLKDLVEFEIVGLGSLHIQEKKGFSLLQNLESGLTVIAYARLSSKNLDPIYKRRGDMSVFNNPEDKPSEQANPAVYRYLGAEAGHLIAAQHLRYSKTSLSDSFYRGNICPMSKSLNISLWKSTEDHERALIKKCIVVHSMSGPIFNFNRYPLVPVPGPKPQAKPSAFFKVLFLEYKGKVVASQSFIFPNEDYFLYHFIYYYACPISEINRLTGLNIRVDIPPTWQSRPPLRPPQLAEFMAEEDKDAQRNYFKELENRERCEHCFKLIGNQVAKEQHQEIMKKYTCNVSNCKKGFCSSKLLKAHRSLDHFLLFAFNCKYCNIPFGTKKAQTTHEEICPEKDTMRKFKCQTCDFVFETQHKLNQHQRDYHQNNNFINIVKKQGVSNIIDQTSLPRLTNHHPKKQYTCTYNGCGQTFIDRRIYRAHCKLHLPIKSTITSPSKITLKQPKPKATPKKTNFFCEPCDRYFFSKQALRNHDIQFHLWVTNGNFPCSQCNLSYNDEKDLKIHERISHLEKKEMCTKCSFKTPFKHKLRKHMVEKHEEAENRVYHCRFCDSKFNKISCRNMHEKIHNKPKGDQNNCPICNECMEASSISAHMLVKHTKS